MFILIVVIAVSVCAGGTAHAILAKRRPAAHGKAAEQIEFQRACDELRIMVGELVGSDAKGSWLNRKLALGGLIYTSTHDLPLGRLVAAKLSSDGACRYCGLRLHPLFEIAAGDKEHFPRLLCTLCPSLKCGVIELNGAHAQSNSFGTLIESTADVRTLLGELRGRYPDAASEIPKRQEHDPRYPTGQPPAAKP